MPPLFKLELFNQPFGDPVLYIRLADEKKALLIDLGQLSAVPSGKLFPVSHVFVTHTHMDHFIGFDHLVRLNLSRDKILRIYGPEGIIRNVRGKLQGYTWNLVEDYPFVVEVTEISARKLRQTSFICRDRFESSKEQTRPFEGIVDSANPHYTVKAMSVDHKIPSIVYVLEERFHININRDRLLQLGFSVGSWLRDLKDNIWEGRPDSSVVQIPGQAQGVELGELKKEIAMISAGQKIAYVADCRGTEKNIKKIISFVEGANILFCEAAFLEKDREKAASRGHLTARQAGFIARCAGVKNLSVFHFSPRYEHCPELLYSEAEQEFRGTDPS